MNIRGSAFQPRISFVWTLIIALACLVYSLGISHESLWCDETYSLEMARHSPGEIIALTRYDIHPPLYYLLLHLVWLVLGDSEWALRMLSVAGAVGTVSLGAGPVRRLFGDKTALAYAIAVLCTPAILTYAHEARMYALTIFVVTAGALFAYLAVQSNRTSDWVLFGLATLAAAYLHYYGLIAAFYTHLFVCGWILLKKRKQIRVCLTTSAVAFVAYLPWLAVFIKQIFDVHTSFWLGPVSWQSVFVAFLQPFAYKQIYPTILPTMLLALLVALFLMISGIVFAGKKRAEKEFSLSLLSLFVYFSTITTTILVSLFLMPVFYARYLLVCVGLVLLLISLGIRMLPGRYLPLGALAAFALLNVFTIKDIYTQKFNYPMREMAEALGGVIQPGDLIVTSDSYAMGPALYYFPQAEHYYVSSSTEAQQSPVLKMLVPELHQAEDLEELLSTHPSFWHITANAAPRNMSEILEGKKGWEKSQEPVRVTEPYSFVGFSAQKYVYSGIGTEIDTLTAPDSPEHFDDSNRERYLVEVSPGE